LLIEIHSFSETPSGRGDDPCASAFAIKKAAVGATAMLSPVIGFIEVPLLDRVLFKFKTDKIALSKISDLPTFGPAATVSFNNRLWKNYRPSIK
jgi:hypothetical protein